MHWFREAGFGMMTHFGLYSVLDGDYRGQPCSEWARHTFRIPRDEYHGLLRAFDPVYLDTDEWIKMEKDAGMKYFVLTAKHHEGFAMFKSRVSRFNVVDSTPYGKDIVGMFAESCYKAGVRFGVYYSQDLDWEEKDGGGSIPSKWCENAHNTWDYPDHTADFDRYLREKAEPQVEELLRNYGEMCLIWFDCPWTMTKEQSRRLYDLVKSIQPDCLVSARIGHGLGDYGGGGDNEFDMKGGEGLYETPCTLSGNGFWNFSVYDQGYKQADEIRARLKKLNSRNVNLLLNIGPDHLGRLPGKAISVLKDLAKA